MNRLIVAAVAILAAAVIAGVMVLTSEPSQTPVRSTGEALVGGDFTLVNQDGETVHAADFRGKFMLVYFGFTYCPDVCPTELQIISTALDKLGRKADEITPVFITVDPERDTPEAMKAYVGHFYPGMVGLTGTPEQVARAAKAYKVYYRKVEDPSISSDYTVDHSSIVFLMDREGRYVAHYPHGTTPEAMAESIRSHL